MQTAKNILGGFMFGSMIGLMLNVSSLKEKVSDLEKKVLALELKLAKPEMEDSKK